MEKAEKVKTLQTVIRIIVQLALIGAGGYYMYMFVRPVFGIIFNIGSVLGAFLSLIAILVGIFLKQIIEFCKKHYKSRKGKIVLNTVFTVLTVGVVCFCLTLGSIIAASTTNADVQNTVIVLGCSVRGDKPSYTLKTRINSAYDYLNKNPESIAVLSGG